MVNVRFAFNDEISKFLNVMLGDSFVSHLNVVQKYQNTRHVLHVDS